MLVECSPNCPQTNALQSQAFSFDSTITRLQNCLLKTH